MDESNQQKKRLGPLAWIGIGCGGLILLIVVCVIVGSLILGPKIKEFAEQVQENPSRAQAELLTRTGVAEMVAADDANKRYTIREKKTGKLTTFYWDEEKKQPGFVEGDFSAIPQTVPPPAPEAVQ